MNSRMINVANVVQCTAIAAIVLFLGYSFHFNVDFWDEGFYLYYYRWGSEVSSFNFYHLLVSPLGELFSHQLIYYRYLSLVLILSASLGMASAFKLNNPYFKWLIPLSLGLMYFNLPSTFSYNTLVLAGGAWLLVLLTRLEGSRTPMLVSMGIGLISFLIFSARAGSGIIFLLLCLMATFLMVSQNKKRWILIACSSISFLGLITLAYFIWQNSFTDMLGIMKTITKSSHAGLIVKYIKEVTTFLTKSFLPPLLMLMVAKKWFPQRLTAIIAVYLSWLMMREMVLDYDFLSLGFYLIGFTLAYLAMNLKLMGRTDLMWILLSISFYMTSSLGTNNNVIKTNSLNALLLYPCLFFLFFKGRTNQQMNILGAIIFSVGLMTVFKKQFWEYYRHPIRTSQSYVRSHLPQLKHIKLDVSREKTLRQISHFLKSQEFNPATDRILSYPDSPGFVSYQGVRALGSPWNLSFYPQSEETNCFYIAHSKPMESSRLFLILEKPLPDKMIDCAKAKIAQNRWVELKLF